MDYARGRRRERRPVEEDGITKQAITENKRKMNKYKR